MNRNKHTRIQPNDGFLSHITALLLSFTAADAVYIYAVVAKMTENANFAAEQYHSVPLMMEHVLAAVVLYLVGMILIHKNAKT